MGFLEGKEPLACDHCSHYRGRAQRAEAAITPLRAKVERLQEQLRDTNGAMQAIEELIKKTGVLKALEIAACHHDIEKLQSELDRERLWIKEGKKLHDCQKEQIERLQAIAAKAPQCWRLNEAGELVQDCPVYVGMAIFYRTSETHLIVEEVVGKIEIDDVGTWLEWGFRRGLPAEECYGTREAAVEDAKGAGDEQTSPHSSK